MKKFLSIIMLIAIILSCCACGETEQAPTPTETTLDSSSPEAMYGHIDQNTPVNGIYKIWNAEGVKAMASHPDGSFEILCDIDMRGAVLEPIGSASATALSLQILPISARPITIRQAP